MKILIIINDAPYGNERMYNALRLTMTLQKEHSDLELRIFLMSDSVTGAIPNQTTPDGFYNIERMLRSIAHQGAEIKLCGTCLNARGMKELQLLEGTEASNMKQLSAWVMDSDKVITF